MNGFAFWVGVGAGLGLWRVARSASQQQAGVWLNIGLVVLAMALVGARLSYAAVHWAYYARRLVEIPQFWLGGLSWPGALAGAWLGVLMCAASYRTARGRRIPLGLFSDRLYPMLPPVAITAWLGSWQAGVVYGGLLPSGTWWAIPSLDESGLYHLRWPLQPAAALALLMYFAVLERLVKPHHPHGLLSGAAFLGLLLNLIAASLLRADAVPRVDGIALDAWIGVAYLALLLIFLLLHDLFARVLRKQPSTN